jgi:hypothetical protein
MGMRRAFSAAAVVGSCVAGGFAGAQSTGVDGAVGASPAASPLVPGKASEGTSASKHHWKPLRSAEATATSFLQNDWSRYEENYHPNYVLDGNPATAWVEGAEGFGENEEITIPLSAVAHARALRLQIWNGYQKSMHLWTKNAMPEKVEITVSDPHHQMVVKTVRTLTRTWGPQEVVIDIPPKQALASVSLSIGTVYRGEKFDDTCVSDILVDVDSDVAYNAAAEKAKYDALLGWTGRRKEAAAYFASRPAEYPFAFTKYHAKKTTLDPNDFKQRFATREALAKGVGQGRYQAFGNGSVRVLPDGIGDTDWHVDEFAQLMKNDQLALVETKDEIVAHRTLQEGMEEVWTSASRVLRTDDQKAAKAIAFDVHDVITERTPTDYKRHLLLVYGQDGRLETLYRTTVTDDYEIEYSTLTTRDEIWSLSYDAAGKVKAIALESLEHHHNVYEKDRKGREREDKRAKRVVFTGVADKSS